MANGSRLPIFQAIHAGGLLATPPAGRLLAVGGLVLSPLSSATSPPPSPLPPPVIDTIC